MNILAFDTCFDACSVAVGRGLRSLSPSIVAHCEPMQAGHAERLMPMIETAMRETGLSVSQLDRIAMTVGPGTFTGSRITVAAARALALAARVPLVPVTSLNLMAMNMRANATGASELAIAADMRRGEVYLERFDPHTLVSRAPAACLSVNDAAAALGQGSAVIAGSAAKLVAAEAARQGRNDVRAVAEDLLPDAFDMLFLAMELPAAATVSPLYLRAPDAKPPANPAIARAVP